MRISLSLTVLCAIPAGALSGQSLPPLDAFHYRALGPSDGLPGSDVRQVQEDPDGLLYIASGGGLSTFDGRRVERVPVSGFESEALFRIHTDRAGRVWALSRAGDLGFVADDTVARVARAEPTTARIDETSDGRLWLSGELGLQWLDVAEPSVELRSAREIGLREGWVQGVYEPAPGEWLAVTEHGLIRIERDPGSGEPVATRTIVPLDNPFRHAIRLDSAGLWIPEKSETLRYADGAVRAFGPGSPEHDRMWFEGDLLRLELETSDGARLAAYDPPDRYQYVLRHAPGGTTRLDLRRALPFRTINRLFEDHEGGVWIATDRGLIHMSRRRVLALTTADGLAESFTVPVIQTRDGSVWVGTWGGGLHRFADGRLARRYTTSDGLPDDRIRSLYESEDGSLWVGGNGGITRIRNGRPDVVQRTGGDVRAFARTPDGRFWAGGTDHLWVRGADSFEVVRPDVFDDLGIWSIHASGDGSLWIAAERGLYRLRDARIDRFGEREGLRSPYVVSIHEGADGDLWFGTYGHGLHRLTSGRLVAITTEDGLPHDGIWSMLEDDAGGVWLSSDAGVFRVDRARLHEVADAKARGDAPPRPLQPLGFAEEGGPGPESNRASPGAWRLDDGRLVFNNVAGLVVIDPELALRPPPVPTTRITAVFADGREVDIDDAGIRFPRGTRHVAVEFVALSYRSPDQHRFRYRLVGYDDDWIAGGARGRADYTNLAPGRYEFRVQGRTGLGEWSEAAPVPMRVAAFPWQLWWVQALAAAAILAALVVGYRYRVRHLIEVERLRLRIASDLHDDVGSNLSSIALLSQMLESRVELGGLEGRQLSRIREAANETVVALREIIWLVDPRNDDLRDLVVRMRSVGSELLGDALLFHGPEDAHPRQVGMPLMRNAFLVYKEALHNAVKHAPGVPVTVSVRADAGELVVVVRDEGRGFDPGSVSRGMGIDSMRRRAAAVGGTLSIEPSSRGTTVRFAAPLA